MSFLSALLGMWTRFFFFFFGRLKSYVTYLRNINSAWEVCTIVEEKGWKMIGNTSLRFPQPQWALEQGFMMHVTSPAMPVGHIACLYSLCMLYCLICNYKYMFTVTSKPSLGRGVHFSGILNLWHSFFRNSGGRCDSFLLTVTFVQKDCQRKPIAMQWGNWLLPLSLDMHCLLSHEAIFYAWLLFYLQDI